MKSAKDTPVKEWKPALKALGFEYTQSMFLRDTGNAIPWIISIQRNLHHPTFKISTTLCLKNPLIPQAENEVILMSNVRRDGIHLRDGRDAWWPAENLPEALGPIQQFAIPWFEKHST